MLKMTRNTFSFFNTAFLFIYTSILTKIDLDVPSSDAGTKPDIRLEHLFHFYFLKVTKTSSK